VITVWTEMTVISWEARWQNRVPVVVTKLDTRLFKAEVLELFLRQRVTLRGETGCGTDGCPSLYQTEDVRG
jgi:hypothetical protein